LLLNKIQHIGTVMDSVASADRCTCAPKITFDGKTYPPKAAQADAPQAAKVDI
jgi:hypothetical protein